MELTFDELCAIEEALDAHIESMEEYLTEEDAEKLAALQKKIMAMAIAKKGE